MVNLTKTRLKSLTMRFNRLIAENRAKVKDIAEIDFRAYWDSSLTEEENLSLLLDKFAVKDLQEDKEGEQMHIKEIEANYEKEFKESIQSLKSGDETGYFKQLQDYIGVIVKGYANALIVEGMGGIGKTHQILKTLTDMKAEFKVIYGYSTALEFYQDLFYNNDKILVIDDLSGVFSRPECIGILKSALDTYSKRFVRWSSTTDKLKVPKEFEFTGRIIFSINSLVDNPEINALKTRAIYHRLDFSIDDIKKIIMSIAKSDVDNLPQAEREMVAQFIIDNSDESTNELNLRTLLKAFGIYKFAKESSIDWKPSVLSLLSYDETRQAVKLALEFSSDVKTQIKKFAEMTGLGRATFYNTKKQMGMCRRYKCPNVQ